MLRRIGNGEIKSYDELDINATFKKEQKDLMIKNQRLTHGKSQIDGKLNKKELDEIEGSNTNFEVLKLEK